MTPSEILRAMLASLGGGAFKGPAPNPPQPKQRGQAPARGIIQWSTLRTPGDPAIASGKDVSARKLRRQRVRRYQSGSAAYSRSLQAYTNFISEQEGRQP